MNAPRYLGRTPKKTPKAVLDGHVLVHNHVVRAVDTPVGERGFRAWTQAPDPKLEECSCGWSGLPHYRVRYAVLAERRAQWIAEVAERRAQWIAEVAS